MLVNLATIQERLGRHMPDRQALVWRDRVFTYADLTAMTPTSLTRDFQCVTGWRVPDVRWKGVKLADVNKSIIGTLKELSTRTEALRKAEALRMCANPGDRPRGDLLFGAVIDRYVTEELGFDACVDHRTSDFVGRLAAACPKGIDVYFENVGGAVFEAVFPLLTPFARIPVCGLISMYTATSLSPGPILLPHRVVRG